jgi:hypothetical protein
MQSAYEKTHLYTNETRLIIDILYGWHRDKSRQFKCNSYFNGFIPIISSFCISHSLMASARKYECNSREMEFFLERNIVSSVGFFSLYIKDPHGQIFEREIFSPNSFTNIYIAAKYSSHSYLNSVVKVFL